MSRRPRSISAPIYDEFASVPLDTFDPASARPTTSQIPDRNPSPPTATLPNAQSRQSPPPNGTSGPRRRRPTLSAHRGQPSIRIRRQPSSQNLRPASAAIDFADADHTGTSGRRRSSSEPQRYQYDGSVGATSLPRSTARPGSVPMDTLAEEGAANTAQYPPGTALGGGPNEQTRRPGLLSRASAAALSTLRLNHANTENTPQRERRGSKSSRDIVFDPLDEYDARLVDLLDVVG